MNGICVERKVQARKVIQFMMICVRQCRFGCSYYSWNILHPVPRVRPGITIITVQIPCYELLIFSQFDFCVKLHAQDAAKCGENLERIALTAAWSEASQFSMAEKAGLGLVEAITHIHNTGLFDQAYAKAATLFTEEQIAAIEWLAIIMNAWNRVGVSSHLQA